MEEISTGLGISFISAGFPSPAEDFTELSISLDKYLIQNPAATFMAYANGNSMLHAGIHNGDILIIDRSLNARDGDIIIATGWQTASWVNTLPISKGHKIYFIQGMETWLSSHCRLASSSSRSPEPSQSTDA